MAGQGDAAAWPTGLCVLLVRHDSVTVQCFHLFTIPLHPDVAAISLVLSVHSVGLAPKLWQHIVHFLSCLPVSCSPTFTDRPGQPVPVRTCPVQCRAEAGALVQCHLHSPQTCLLRGFPSQGPCSPSAPITTGSLQTALSAAPPSASDLSAGALHGALPLKYSHIQGAPVLR